MKLKEFVDECLNQCKDCGRFSAQPVMSENLPTPGDSAWKSLNTHDRNKVCYCVKDTRHGFYFTNWVKIGYPFVKYSEGMKEIGLTADSATKRFFKDPENWRTCPYYAERYVTFLNLENDDATQT